jgi:hypothetical protein
MIAAVVMAAAMLPAQADDPHALKMAGAEFSDAAAGVKAVVNAFPFFRRARFYPRLLAPILMRSKSSIGRRNDIAVVDGLRFGKRTRCAFVQST